MGFVGKGSDNSIVEVMDMENFVFDFVVVLVVNFVVGIIF